MKPPIYYSLLIVVIGIQSCSKAKDEAVVSCPEKIIEITIASSPSTGCDNNSGSITATATGSNGFTFRINTQPFQPTGNFINLPNGNYTITARDSQGCEQTQQTLVGSGIIAGPRFTDVKNLFVVRCNRCHSGPSSAALKDWSVDCVVLLNKELINNRAVIIGDMPRGGPELTATEKSLITDWLSSGGKVEN